MYKAVNITKAVDPGLPSFYENFVEDETGFQSNSNAMRRSRGKIEFSPRSALPLAWSQREKEAREIHRHNQRAVRLHAIERIANERQWNNAYYLVINLWPSRDGQRMDEIVAQRELEIFMKTLARRIDRYGRKAHSGDYFILSSAEPNDKGGHWHWNVLVDFPQDNPIDFYLEIVHRCLNKNRWARPRMKRRDDVNRYMKPAVNPEAVAMYMQKYSGAPWLFGMAGRTVSLLVH